MLVHRVVFKRLIKFRYLDEYVYPVREIYISTIGQVKRYNSGKWEITYGTNHQGYKFINVSVTNDSGDKFKVDVGIHRLVAEIFIDNPDNLNEVNHIDGNKSNNTIHNLEWVTHIENVRHALNTGLTKTSLDNNEVMKIANLLMSGKSDSEISNIAVSDGYNCTSDMIYRIRKKDNWSRLTESMDFPQCKKRVKPGKDIAMKIIDLIHDGKTNKEIISILELNTYFNKKENLYAYLSKFRTGTTWKHLL